MLAAISCHKTLAVAEAGDGQHALILTAAASGVRIARMEHPHAFERQDIGNMSVAPICFGMQRAAVSAHQSGDVRSHDFLAEYPFDGAQDRLVEEGAALHDDFITGFLRIAQLDDLIKGIFDDRIGQPCGDVADARAFLLCLFHHGIHKYRTARTQIHRMLRQKPDAGEFLDRHVDRLRVGLDEGTTAGRTRFVQHDMIDRAVLDAHTLHVLSADVEDKVHTRQEFLRRLVMRHRLDNPVVRIKTGLDQPLPVSGYGRIGDIARSRQLLVELRQQLLGRLQRVSLVVAVKRIDELFVLVNQCGLGRGRTGVDP